MFANVTSIRSLKSSLYYDRAVRNPEKGGEVIMANGVGLHMSPTAQLAMMEAYVNPKFKVKAFSVVISHSDEDNERLKDPKFRERLLHEFVNNCKKRKIDLDNIPYLIAHHSNTDCDHNHMIMLVNHFDGSRIDTQYLGKKMALAAVEVSKKYGLHYPEGWDERERRRNEYQTAAEKSEERPKKQTVAAVTPVVNDTPGVKVGLNEEEEKKLKDRIRRANAVREAQKRREDEAKREEERRAEERVKVQEQKTDRREEDSEVDSELETERESSTRHHR